VSVTELTIIVYRFLCTSVPSFLLQGLERWEEAIFAGDAIFKIKDSYFPTSYQEALIKETRSARIYSQLLDADVADGR